MNYDLTKVHETNLKILKEIDRICRKYRIQYQLDAGTLLGAVRHKGAIPWDDDADIAMTRKNYEAFVKVVKRELPPEMSFLDYRDFQGGKAFYDFTPRIIYNNSRTDEDTAEMQYYEGKLNHLWVDLFILDELPKNGVAAAFTRMIHTVIYGLSMGHRHHLDYSKYQGVQKAAVAGLAAVGKCIPMKALFVLQEKAAKMSNKGKSGLLYYSNYQPDYLYVTLEKEWCDRVTDLEFDGEMLMAPENWHEVLTWIYGEYQKLPPEEQRVPSHSSTEIQIFD